MAHPSAVLVVLLILASGARPLSAQEGGGAVALLAPGSGDPKLHPPTSFSLVDGGKAVSETLDVMGEPEDPTVGNYTLEGIVIGGAISGTPFAVGACETYSCDLATAASAFVIGAVPGVLVGALIGYAIPKDREDEVETSERSSKRHHLHGSFGSCCRVQR